MIPIKTTKEIKIMREGGKILARIMKELEKKVKPGITTKELDKLSEELVFKYGGECSFKGYEGFPACLCTSINEEIVHVAPSSRVLKEGDIISLDLGVFYPSPLLNKGEGGFHTDMAVTLPVGKVSQKTKKLIEVTKNALKIGIEKVKPRNRFNDISRAIQKYVESQAYSARGANGPIRGFNVVRDLCGHGIGRELHEEPQILNYFSSGAEEGKSHRDSEIKEGMVFCLEPMVTAGDWKIKKAKDCYGYQTQDGSLSCHFEHTVAITENGCQVLTR